MDLYDAIHTRRTIHNYEPELLEDGVLNRFLKPPTWHHVTTDLPWRSTWVPRPDKPSSRSAFG